MEWGGSSKDSGLMLSDRVFGTTRLGLAMSLKALGESPLMARDCYGACDRCIPQC